MHKKAEKFGLEVEFIRNQIASIPVRLHDVIDAEHNASG